MVTSQSNSHSQYNKLKLVTLLNMFTMSSPKNRKLLNQNKVTKPWFIPFVQALTGAWPKTRKLHRSHSQSAFHHTSIHCIYLFSEHKWAWSLNPVDPGHHQLLQPDNTRTTSAGPRLTFCSWKTSKLLKNYLSTWHNFSSFHNQLYPETAPFSMKNSYHMETKYWSIRSTM